MQSAAVGAHVTARPFSAAAAPLPVPARSVGGSLPSCPGTHSGACPVGRPRAARSWLNAGCIFLLLPTCSAGSFSGCGQGGQPPPRPPGRDTRPSAPHSPSPASAPCPLPRASAPRPPRFRSPHSLVETLLRLQVENRPAEPRPAAQTHGLADEKRTGQNAGRLSRGACANHRAVSCKGKPLAPPSLHRPGEGDVGPGTARSRSGFAGPAPTCLLPPQNQGRGGRESNGRESQRRRPVGSAGGHRPRRRADDRHPHLRGPSPGAAEQVSAESPQGLGGGQRGRPQRPGGARPPPPRGPHPPLSSLPRGAPHGWMAPL